MVQRYTNALLLSASNANAVNEVAKDVHLLASFLSDIEFGEKLKQLIIAPLFSKTEKKNQLFSMLGTIHPLTKKFFELVIDRGRENIIPYLAEAFDKSQRKRDGIVLIKISSATPVSKEQENEIKLKLSKTLSKQIESTIELNPNLIGGLVIEVDGKRYDSTISRRIEELKTILNH